MNRQALTSLIGVGLLAVVGTGCRTYHQQSEAMRTAWVQGQYHEAAEQFVKRAEKKDDGKDGVIWHLEAGAALRATGQFTESNREFGEAAQQIDDYEEKAKVRVGNELGATMSNQQNLPYEGRSYDKIMLHTYRALNYLASGDVERTRPELIRAYQRQQDAVRENARRIQKAQQAERESEHRQQVELAKSDPAFTAQLRRSTENLEGFRFYADYVNPFTVYLDGLYFLHAGAGASDAERAHKSLQRVIEVAGDNRFVQADVAMLQGESPEPAGSPLTYVIFETGRAASRNQDRIDIPIIVADVSYVGAAFPRLEFHQNYARTLRVKGDELEEQTVPVASVDAIVALDFKNEWPSIVARTLISAAAKGVAAYAANTAARQQNDWAGVLVRIGTAIAQASVNIADTRTWTTLPKEFQIARFVTPASRTLTVSTGSGPSATVNLVDGEVNVVYVKSVTPTTPLVVNQFKLR